MINIWVILCFYSRRTPRRKLFSSSKDDDSPFVMHVKTSKSKLFLNDNNNSTGKIL
jgi:hypothetical protein